MVELYWICFLSGAAFAVALVLFDAVLGGWIDGVLDALPDALHPMALVSGVVGFGGVGILLSTYTPLGAFAIAALSLAAAALLAVGLFFFYIKPMGEAEHSIAYSMQELTGKIGEVSVPIPVGGYGEVGFTFGHGMIYHTADTSEREPLAAGEKVLAIEVKDGVVTVCRWTEA